MKLFAPKYYGEFVCIADKCRHSCCIGWEIDIDDKTKNKYDSLSCIYSKKIAESIDENGAPVDNYIARVEYPMAKKSRKNDFSSGDYTNR